MVGDLLLVVLLAMAVAAMSVTISLSKVFKNLRDNISSRNAWLGELVSCPYCFSHWLSFLAVLVYRPQVLEGGAPFLNLFLTAFVLVCLASLFGGLIYRAYKS